MSNVEADDNDADGDLIFISEEHIDLEESGQSKPAEEELEQGEEGDGVGTAADASADDAEMEMEEERTEDADLGHEEEQENEEHEEKLGDKMAEGKDEGLMVVDEWDEDEVDSEADEEVKERDPEALNPEDEERHLLNMPTLKSVLEDIGNLKQNRRVVIHPLTMEELEHPKLKEVIANDACEEVKVQFVRSKIDDKLWTGIVVLNFMTSGSAVEAMEEVKQIKEDLIVKLETNTTVLVEHFVKESKTEKRWTDNVLVVRNLTDDVKLEAVKELFPDAEEVVVHKEASKPRRETTIARGYAFLLYRTDEAAATAEKAYAERKLVLDGHRLSVLQYRLPIESIPRGLLRLRERRLVLRHVEKLKRKLEKAAVDPSAVKVPEDATQRLEKCKELIEKDDKARKDANLPCPTRDELNRADGLPVLGAYDSRHLLIRLGVIEEKKEPKDDSLSSRKRSRSPRRSGGGGGSTGDRNGQRMMRKKGPSPRNTRRPSPRKRNWVQKGGRNQRTSSGFGNMMRNSGGIGAQMFDPTIALMMQQAQMMNSSPMINPGLLMQQNMGAALIGAGGLMGSIPQQNMPFLGGLSGQAPQRVMEEQASKIIRLDETGNFRSNEDRRFSERDHMRRMEGHPRGHLQGRDFDRSSFRGGDMHQERHHRSRSPDRSSRPIQRMEGRSYADQPSAGRDTGSSRGGDESEISNPVNLLLNLSQMLSQKMEQKRQQVERDRRSYDRGSGGDYHGGQR